MLPFWLGIAGMGVQLLGTGLAMWGQAQQNQEDRRKLDLQAQQEREAQTMYQNQQAATKKDMADTASQFAIKQTQLGIQGRTAVGSSIATSAVSNLGGASIQRRVASIQRQIGLEQTNLSLEAGKTRRGYETQLEELGYSAKWAGERASEYSAQSEWLRQYGWTKVVGIGLQGAGAALETASQIAWPSPTPKASPAVGGGNPRGTKMMTY